MNAPLPPIPLEDREHILQHTVKIWPQLAGTRFFIAGATGFYGKWLLESIAAANDELGANVRATLLSRDPAGFKSKVPHLGSRREFEWIVGEPADFDFPAGGFDYLIDFATPSATEVGVGGTVIVERCLQGSANLIQFAQAAGVRRVLYASSGAVYGRQPGNIERLAEDFLADAATVTPYGRLKLLTEALLLDSGLDCVIARGFAFIGPYLPLTDKFAVGSFIRDALTGIVIRINSDGTPSRSYMYGADLVIWLLVLLLKGKFNRVYNVGSDQAITIAALASLVASNFVGSEFQLAYAPVPVPAEHYVPNIGRARVELGLDVLVPLPVAITRTAIWARKAMN